MKVVLEVDDADSLTGGSLDTLKDLLEDAMLPLGMLLTRLDPDSHVWLVFLEEVEKRDQLGGASR